MGRAQASLGNFDIVMGRRRGVRREFPVLDDELAMQLERVGTNDAAASWETLDEAQRRLARARRDGENNDERVSVLATALSAAAVSNVANKIERSAIDYTKDYFGPPMPSGSTEAALRAAQASFAERLGNQPTAVNAAALLEEAALELRAAAAILQAKAILTDEEDVLRGLFKSPGVLSWDSQTREKGKLEGRFSEDDWADVLMSCYKGYDSTSDITMTDTYLAALSRQHAFGSTTSHSVTGTQQMLEEMYQEAQVVRDRVRPFLD